MTTRRNVVLAGAAGLLVAHRLGHGQPVTPVRRVGSVSLGSKDSPAEGYAAFKQAMNGLGWLEGKNVEYRAVYADGDARRLDGMATELMRQQVDVILVGNAISAIALQRATKTIPIVMTAINNAVGNGLVASLAKPGGNITGITTLSDEVLGKLVGILHEIAPAARRIAFLLNENNPNHPVFWTAAQSACAAMDLVPLHIVANGPAQFAAAIEAIVRQRAQAVVVVADPIFLNERVKLQALMQVASLPVAYAWREHVVAGGLFSYAPDLSATNRHAAIYVDKILKGAKPADLPVELPTKFDLVINLKTAKALGLTIPQPLLLRADEMIQ